MGKRRLTRPESKKGKQRKSGWILWAVVAAIVLVGGGVAAYLLVPGPAKTARTGNPAPDFTLRLLDGKSIALSSLRGRPVLVSFWHST
jgi:cytochrome oxidase Cu insertion factor (SCO1/SenC/PrrC family)